jgi:hypothetical protein
MRAHAMMAPSPASSPRLAAARRRLGTPVVAAEAMGVRYLAEPPRDGRAMESGPDGELG